MLTLHLFYRKGLLGLSLENQSCCFPVELTDKQAADIQQKEKDLRANRLLESRWICLFYYNIHIYCCALMQSRPQQAWEINVCGIFGNLVNETTRGDLLWGYLAINLQCNHKQSQSSGLFTSLQMSSRLLLNDHCCVATGTDLEPSDIWKGCLQWCLLFQLSAVLCSLCDFTHEFKR